jgi:hypothetical protein
VFPARANQVKSYHETEDELQLSNVAVQIGSVGLAGPGGMLTHKVERSSSDCKVRLKAITLAVLQPPQKCWWDDTNTGSMYYLIGSSTVNLCL